MIDEKVDAVVICATTYEFDAINRALDNATKWKRKEKIGTRTYELKRIAGTGPNAGLTIALVSPNEIGRLPAAIVARDLLYHFLKRPDYVILCGIAAANPAAQYQLGDVVLPSFIKDYAEQKRSEGEFKLRARHYNVDGWLHSEAVEHGRTNWYQEVPQDVIEMTREMHETLRWPPKCHHKLGMACGDYVLDDKNLVDDILGRLSASSNLPVTAVEMESTAIARGIEPNDGNAPKFIVIKAISDFAFGKQDSAQPYARVTAAYFLRGFLIKLADSKFVHKSHDQPASAPRLVLGPSPHTQDMLSNFPLAYAAQWRDRTIDGAIEILRCSRPSAPYGGFSREQVICNFDNNLEWPDYFGELTRQQIDALTVGLLGDSEKNIPGWLKEKGGKPGRIRVLRMPPTPPVDDRSTIDLKFANSDYFTVRTITELSRIDRQHGCAFLKQAFPERWAAPQTRFSKTCVPYHVSAQAIITCRTPDQSRFLLLASVNAAHTTLTSGWVATMAEQMWAPDRSSPGEPWWAEPAKPYLVKITPISSRAGDKHINDTLERGLSEEFGLNFKEDILGEPLLLLAAIEEDMYFVTFIYVVTVNLSLASLYEKWYYSEDNAEAGVLAAYQLTGMSSSGEELNGARRLADVMARDTFDGGPYLLPTAQPAGSAIGPWHVSSRLRMFALGMHLWPNKFQQLVGPPEIGRRE